MSESEKRADEVLAEHSLIGTQAGRQGAGQTIPDDLVLCFSCGWMRMGEYGTHVAAALSAAGCLRDDRAAADLAFVTQERDASYAFGTWAQEHIEKVEAERDALLLPAREPGVPMSHAEKADLQRAYDLDVWAHEFNSVPTAVDRILAARDDREGETVTEWRVRHLRSGSTYPSTETEVWGSVYVKESRTVIRFLDIVTDWSPVTP